MIQVELQQGREAAERVNGFFRQHGETGSMRPSDLLFVATLEGEVVGSVRYCVQADVHLLRSMLVDPALRGRGVGRTLMSAAIAHADRAGVTELFCLSYLHLEPFYTSIGFHRVDDADIPRILETRMISYRLQDMETICLKRAA